MPARRDYAMAWRNACLTLTQIPVAGLLATDYFYQQSFRRYSRYLTDVSTLFAFRPAAPSGDDEDDVTADVLSEELVGAASDLVRDLVTLPAEAAQHFTQQTEDAVREVLRRIQPDADVDTHRYVVNELGKITAELYRLRSVASAETRAAYVSGSAKARRSSRADNAFRRTVTAMLKALSEPPPSKGLPARSPARAATVQERTLDVIQGVVDSALKTLTEASSVPPSPSGKDMLRVRSSAKRLSVAYRNAQDELGRAKKDLTDETESIKKSGRTHHARGTRRSSDAGS